MSQIARPVGGEPFGTQVMFDSPSWGTQRALVIRSPKRPEDRELLDSFDWGIVMESGGMTYVPADMLRMGWD